jgi:hypothetical protein
MRNTAQPNEGHSPLSTTPDNEAIEMAHAESLPQIDASSLVDPDRLETQIIEMYRRAAGRTRPSFTSRSGACWPSTLGYPQALLERLPAEALASFSLAAPVAAPRVGPVEDEMAHALGVSDRVLDRRRGAAGDAEQSEALESRGVHHCSQIADIGV